MTSDLRFTSPLPMHRSLTTLCAVCVLLITPSIVRAESARPPFAVQVIQGKDVLKAKNSVYSISRQEPFKLRIQAPQKTKLALLVKGSESPQATLDEKSHIYTPEKLKLGVDAKKYGLISETEYSWLLLGEDNATKKSVQRKRWVNTSIEGFMLLSGSHWKLGTYILTTDLDLTVAAVPVDANGNFDFKKKVQYVTIKTHLLDASQEDECHLIQNFQRNIGVDIVSCEELNKTPSQKEVTVFSSSASNAQAKDTLPFNTPRSNILVLGTLSPVVDVCQNARGTALLSGQDDSGRDLREIRAYDIQTKELLSIATKDGAGKNTGWSSKAFPTKPFYVRWLPRAFTETDKTAVDFSTKHKIGITKKCDGSPSTLGFSMTPSAITDVRSAGPETLKVGAGRGIVIGSFTFTSTKSSPSLKTFLEQVKFTALVTGNVTLSEIKIGMQSQGNTYKTECLYNDPPFITCVIPDYMGEVSGETTYTLTADIAKTSGAGSVQLMLSDFGTPFTPGSVFWKNDAESFRWMSPLLDTVKGMKVEL